MDAKLQRRQRAAAIIQRYFRAYLARKAFMRLKAATQTIQAHARGWVTRKRVAQVRDRRELEAHFQATMARHRERIYVLEKHKRLVQSQPARDIEIWHERRVRAACRIQGAWRGFVQRRLYQQMDPERAKREAASRDIQKAFKGIINQAQSAHRHSAANAGYDTPVSPAAAHARAAVPETRMSATVLMGSPPRTAHGLEAELVRASQPALGPEQAQTRMIRGLQTMSAKRYSELRKQVETRVRTYKALAQHRRPDVHATDTRLKALLQDYHSSAQERLAAAHARATQTVALEALTGALDNGGLRPLSQLQDPNPSDFPRPAKGSERWERAVQAHAAGLADARAGPAWWRHLKPLAKSDLQKALLQEDQDHWKDMETVWTRQWARVEATEAHRPDPLTELGLRSAGAPRPALADLAVYQPETAGAPGQGDTPATRDQELHRPGREKVTGGSDPASADPGSSQTRAVATGATGRVQATSGVHAQQVASQQPLAHTTHVNSAVVQGAVGTFVAPT